MRAAMILFSLVGVACGGPAEGPSDPARIEVPVQPPQVLPVAVASSDAGFAEVARTAAFSCGATGLAVNAGRRAYCAYADPATWTDAERRCIEHGGHLVALPTRAAQESLERSLGNLLGVTARALWVGLEAVDRKKKQWRWSTGEPVKEFERWNEGEPNNWDGNESCGELLTVNGKWNDTRCNLEQGFLCQAQGSKPLDCKGGRALATPPGKFCYDATPLNYAEAKKACVKRGGALATLATEETSKEAQGSLEQRFKVPRLWIGLSDLGEQGTWAWPDGSLLNGRPDARWKPGEPNNYGREGCVELFTESWQWNDLDCNVALPSVCEGPAVPHAR
jgi:hypothetical protein